MTPASHPVTGVAPAARAAEVEKYARAYGAESYRMGGSRMRDAVKDLGAVPCRGSYLDVGCGRGEMLAHAERLGFWPVRGVEVVADLVDGARVVAGAAHELPFGAGDFDVVSLFDVIEHLLPGDDEAACRELARVARRHVVLTANDRASHLEDGTCLHVNRRSYDEWDRLFRAWFAPGDVVRLGGPRHHVSEGWRVDL